MNMPFSDLIQADLRFVAQRMPKDVRALLKKHAGRLFLGGGFIRSVIAGEPVNDIDLFGDDAEWLRKAAEGLSAERTGSRIHKTGNAITLLRSEEHTSELKSLMRIPYAVFSFKKKTE